MASYTNISFSQNSIEEQVKMAVNLAIEDTVKEIKTWEFFEDAVVENLGEFYKEITSQDLRAWLHYMGTGTYMDDKNEQLDDYIGGKYWNKHREEKVGAEITRRGNVKYTSPNWITGKGTMTRIGFEPAGAFASKGVKQKEDFYAKLQKANDNFVQRLQENLKKIDVKSSIITTKENI